MSSVDGWEGSQTVGTPEGDGEFAPDAPLAPEAVESATDGLQVPSGSAPAAYEADLDKAGSDKAGSDKLDADKPGADNPVAHELSLMEKVIDEISHGTLLP